jgi:hypothetical protein
MLTDFDKKIQEIDHYKKYPCMMPFIGCKYNEAKLKLMIIAESHYLPEDSDKNLDASLWYENNESILSEEEKNWINTRKILNGEWNNEGHKIYKNIEKSLSEIPGFKANNTHRCMDSVVFMNAYQRPANYGNSISEILDKNIDNEVATSTICKVIEVVCPDLVIITSIFVVNQLWDDIPEFPNVKWGFTAHPASLYWNKSAYEYNKEKFKRIITDALKQ